MKIWSDALNACGVEFSANTEVLIFDKKIASSDAAGVVELFFISREICSAAGFPAAETQVHCQKRQKGEIPGTEKLSSETPVLTADPAMVLYNQDHCLLCGFLEMTRHLGHLEWSEGGLRAVAEYHPAYRPGTDFVRSQKMVLLQGSDPVQLFEQYTELVKQYNPTPQRSQFPRYTVGANWHYYGPTMTENELDEELAAIKAKNIPLDVYQLDDGWERDYGDWHPNDKWNSGMAQAADKIKAAGMIPGIWITPFLCGNIKIAEQHPQWLLRDASGEALTMKIGPLPFRIFDPSHPECAAWIKSFLKEIYNWGYRYFKIDFTRCLFLDPAAVPFDKSITLLELYRRGITLLRETLGDECCLNLCGGHEGATIGLADVTRTGSDTYGNWAKSNGAWTRIQQCVMRSWMSRFRMGDPDASIMRLNSEGLSSDRDFTPHIYVPSYSSLSQGSLNDDEAATFILNQFLCGGISEIGERLPDLQPERLKLLHKIIPPCGTPAKMVDFFQHPLPRFYRTRIVPRCSTLPEWEVISVLNVSDDAAAFIYPGTVNEPVMVFHPEKMTLLGIFNPGDKITTPVIAPHGSAVLKFIPLPRERKPFFAATDLHYSAGGVEVETVSVTESTINGKLSSPWDTDVKVAGAFPRPDGSWAIVTATVNSNSEFTLTYA